MQAILAVATAGVLTCPPKALIACNATIVFGVYGRSCEEVEAFTSACIGCAAGHSPIVHSVAIVDDARNGTAVGRYTGWRCGGIYPADAAREQHRPIAPPIVLLAASSS